MILFRSFLRRAAIAAVCVLSVPAAVGIGLTSFATEAKAAVVSSISVQGNQRVDATTIKTYITIKPGIQYGAADVDESVKVLYGTGLFSDVNIARSGSTLVVAVAENPVINSVVFEGNRKVKSDILVQIVTSKTRGVLTDARLQTDISRIKQHYERNGRSGVQINVDIVELGNNRVDLIFLIAEGDRTGVASISFVGNNAFSSQRLRRVITTRQTNMLSWLNRGDIFSEEKLAADREMLRRHYLKYGYADFQILAVDSDFDAANGKYHVVFTIDEGPKYRFGRISVDSSIPGVDPLALQQVVTTHEGDVFNASKVEKSVEALTVELARVGYVFSQVRPRGDRNYVENIIDLTFVVDEGPRAYVERIEIRGNTKTRDYVIRREFDLSEGDAYNRVLVDKAERALRGLDFFETVRITTQPGSAPDKVVIVVFVQDKSTGSFSVAAGVSTSDGLIGEISLEERNFLGRGQNLRISVGGGSDDRTYNINFRDPYFLGSRMSAGVNAYHNTSNRTSRRPYAVEKTGGGASVGLPLTDDAHLTFNYKIVSEDVSDVAADAAAIFTEGTRLTSSLGYTYLYSTLDNRMDPREGKRFKLTQDFAGVGGDARYIKTVVDARAYRPVVEDSDVIGMLRVGAGNITGLGQSVANSDAFFKGPELVRGFAPNGMGPRHTASGHAVGGKNYVVGSAEVQFPLPAFPPDFGLRGAFFADAGMLFDTDSTIGGIEDDASFRSSVGGSVLWASPFGLLRADFSHVLSKEDYDKTQVFRLGAGTTF